MKQVLTQTPAEVGVSTAAQLNINLLLTLIKLSFHLAGSIEDIGNLDPELKAAVIILKQSSDNAGVILETFADHHLTGADAGALLQVLSVSIDAMKVRGDLVDELLSIFQLLGSGKKSLHGQKYKALLKFVRDQIRADLNNQPQLVWFQHGSLFFKQAGEIPAQISGE